ncbi:MAG: UDP-3-O-(3-hydroxymyristoyl)glucosamine N-acyltransferase [Mariprofundaceae bacterium]|nr:UDP-3-O-(3-hydroxymyristoyl)glucosamine N-acyltransferase [Mariprofundaceae bacterium]
MRLSEVAALVAGQLEHGNAEAHIDTVNTLLLATSTQLAFLANTTYQQDALTSQAGVIIIGLAVMPELSRPVIRVQDPYLAYAQIQSHLQPQPKSQGLRAKSAIIHPEAELADDVDIADGVIIEAGVYIGEGSRIGAGCIIEKNAHLSSQCFLHPKVVICADSHLGKRVLIQAGAVIGSDGFGFAWSGQAFIKIPQVGRVVIEDDVEIGANTCIDRAALGETRIGYGVKIDNLVQIAHNVEIGAHSAIAGQAGFAGSSKIGKGCQFGGQSAVAGHLEISDGCSFAGKSGIMSNVDKAGQYSGYPAIPLRTWLRSSAIFSRLPKLWSTLISKKTS